MVDFLANSTWHWPGCIVGSSATRHIHSIADAHALSAYNGVKSKGGLFFCPVEVTDLNLLKTINPLQIHIQNLIITEQWLIFSLKVGCFLPNSLNVTRNWSEWVLWCIPLILLQISTIFFPGCLKRSHFTFHLFSNQRMDSTTKPSVWGHTDKEVFLLVFRHLNISFFIQSQRFGSIYSSWF